MKLQEILGKSLPVSINLCAEDNWLDLPLKVQENLKIIDFLEKFKGPTFNILDYKLTEVLLDIYTVHKYCLVSSEDYKPTLEIGKATRLTPKNKIPYIELNISSDTGAPVVVFLVWSDDNELTPYIPIKGNTVRFGSYETLENSGIHDFEWQNKWILEKSDLLYIVKDVNREALIKYNLETIYNAFQEYDINEIIQPDRNLCIQEFEENLIII